MATTQAPQKTGPCRAMTNTKFSLMFHREEKQPKRLPSLNSGSKSRPLKVLWHELGQLWDLPDPLGFLRHYLQRYKQNFLGSLKANL